MAGPEKDSRQRQGVARDRESPETGSRQRQGVARDRESPETGNRQRLVGRQRRVGAREKVASRSPYFPSQGGDAPTIIAENHDKSSLSSTTILLLIPLIMLNLLRNK
jgi:hypothetical protein